MLTTTSCSQQKKGVSAGNAVNAYSKGGKSGLSSGSILALASGTLKHFTFFLASWLQLAIDVAYKNCELTYSNRKNV